MVIYLHHRRPPKPLACRDCGSVVYVSRCPDGWLVLDHDCRPLEPIHSLRPFSWRVWYWIALWLAAMGAIVWAGLRW